MSRSCKLGFFFQKKISLLGYFLSSFLHFSLIFLTINNGTSKVKITQCELVVEFIHCIQS